MSKIVTTRPAQQHEILGLIDSKIAALTSEIQRLEIARSVFVELNPPKTMQWREIEGPFVTPRTWNKLNLKRAEDERKKMKRKPAVRAERHAIVGLVLAALRNVGTPLTSHDIWTHINANNATPVEKKTMWNAMWVMKSKGLIVKVGAFYRLAPRHK